ncbi:hypothetical protein [Nakamurella aerolata]|uniref:Homeodomain-like domain-containing protein n=1 Tax=Nakamurella aerolata TaxID=1656892 RepID=A0A849A952_9ACTN|nr:hypothetical protein [Nakamurella aerolata]
MIDADQDQSTGPAIDGAPLRRIAAAAQAREAAQREVSAAVTAARDAGLPWAAIGAALGISRQAAVKRYGC